MVSTSLFVLAIGWLQLPVNLAFVANFTSATECIVILTRPNFCGLYCIHRLLRLVASCTEKARTSAGVVTQFSRCAVS